MKIAISANPNAAVSAEAVAAVRAAAELTPAAAKLALVRGGVLLEGEPVSDDALPGKFRALLAALRAHKIDFTAYELDDDADAASATDAERITADAVERIIKRGEQVGEQQTRQSREES